MQIQVYTRAYLVLTFFYWSDQVRLVCGLSDDSRLCYAYRYLACKPYYFENEAALLPFKP